MFFSKQITLLRTAVKGGDAIVGDKREIARAICSIKENRVPARERQSELSHLGETSAWLLADGKGLIEDWTDSRYKGRKDIKIINTLKQNR